jgi:xylose isomerase
MLNLQLPHELETARINEFLGNIDADIGDPQVGNCHYCT